MAIANYLAVSRWAHQINGPMAHLSMTGRSIEASGNTIYSYGRHFPMAEIHRDKQGSTTFVLVNGDLYSVTTSGHQSQVRSAIGNRAQSVIIPFSALDAANIIRGSIQPLEILDDTWTEHELRATLARMRTLCENERGFSVPGFTEERPTYPAEINHSLRTSADIQRDYPYGSVARQTIENEYQSQAARWRDKRNRAIRCATSFIDKNGQEIEQRGDDYIIPTRRHWLGETVFSARVQTSERTIDGPRTRHRRARFLSAFDHNESGMVYFLAELPRTSKAETVAQAFDDLAPAIVKRAQLEDIEVKRQGDIFAIPCDLPPEITRPAPYRRGVHPTAIVKDGQTLPAPGRSSYAYHQRNELLGTAHTATEMLIPQTGETYARGIMRHEPGRRGPDHAAIKLVGWHLIVRNTVPRQ